MPDTTKSTPKKTLTRHHSLLWDVLKGAVIGAAFWVGLRLGLAKLAGWAKGTKANYSFLKEDSTYSPAAIGGGAYSLFMHETESDKERESLIIDKARLQHEVEQLKREKPFTQQIAEQSTQKNSPGAVRE